MASSDKVKVAVRVRPFNRRGKMSHFDISFDFLCMHTYGWFTLDLMVIL